MSVSGGGGGVEVAPIVMSNGETTTTTTTTTTQTTTMTTTTDAAAGNASNGVVVVEEEDMRAKLEALRAQWNTIASAKKPVVVSHEKRRGVVAKRRANDMLATQSLMRELLEYYGGCVHVETLVKCVEEFNVQHRTPLALDEPVWAKFVRDCLVVTDLADGGASESGFKERTTNYWVVADDDMALNDVFEVRNSDKNSQRNASDLMYYLNTKHKQPLYECLSRGTNSLGKHASMDALYKFVVEQWNPKPLRDREEPSEDELRHSIGITLTTDPAFAASVAGREWILSLSAPHNAHDANAANGVGGHSGANGVTSGGSGSGSGAIGALPVVVRNNSGRVSRAAALAAADAIVSGVPPSFVLPPSDPVAIARSASANELPTNLNSPRGTAVPPPLIAVSASASSRSRRRTADGVPGGHQQQHQQQHQVANGNGHQHHHNDQDSASGGGAPRKRHKLPQPEHGHVCKCGARRPAEGSRSKWKLLDAIGDFVCHACYASDETVCPLCQTQYYEDENDPWICCERCERWIHARCDQITDITLFDDSNPRRLVYLCSICRDKAGEDDEAAAAVTASIAASVAANAATNGHRTPAATKPTPAMHEAATSTLSPSHGLLNGIEFAAAVAAASTEHATSHKRGRTPKREPDPSVSPVGAAAGAAATTAATSNATGSAATTGIAGGEERKRGSGRRRKSQTPPSNLQALVVALPSSVTLDRIETKLWSELDADQPVVALSADRAGAALTNLEVGFAEAIHSHKLQLQRELNQRDQTAQEIFEASIAEASRIRLAARESAESDVAERFGVLFETQRNTFLEKQSAMLDGSLPPRPRGRGRPSKADQRAAALTAAHAATAPPLSNDVSPSAQASTSGAKRRHSSNEHDSDDSSHSSSGSADNAAAAVVAAAAAAAAEHVEEDEEEDDDDDYDGDASPTTQPAKKAKKTTAANTTQATQRNQQRRNRGSSNSNAAHGGRGGGDDDDDDDEEDDDYETVPEQQQPANALTSFAKIAAQRSGQSTPSGGAAAAAAATAARIRRTESVDTMHLLCAFSETLEEDRVSPSVAPTRTQ